MSFFKKILLILFASIIMIIAVGVAASYVYKDKIKTAVLNELNKNLNNPIEVGQINFSIIRKFPYASLELENILIIDSFQKDTLLSAEKLFVKFNLLNLYNNNYTIRQAELKNGFVSIYFNEKGLSNYQVWETKKNNHSTTNFNLEYINLQNINVKYSDKKNNLRILGNAKKMSLKGGFHNGGFNINFTCDFYSENVHVKKINYLKNKNLKILGLLTHNNERTSFNANTEIQGLKINVKGELENGYSINVTGSELNLAETLRLVPQEYVNNIKEWEVNGKTNLSVDIKKEGKETEKTAVNATFEIYEGHLKTKNSWESTEITLSGIYNRNFSEQKQSDKITFPKLNCKINNKVFSGSGSIYNFKDLKINANCNVKIELGELYKWNIQTPMKSLSGVADITLFYNGGTGMKKGFVHDFLNAEKSATIIVKDGTLQYNNTHAPLKNINTYLRLDNQDLNIDSLSANIGNESNLHFNGAIENILSQKTSSLTPVKIAGNLYSDNMFFNEVLYDKESNNSIIKIPKNIKANITTSLKDVSFNRFRMRNFTSKLFLNNGIFKISDFTLYTMSGKATGNVTIEQIDNQNIRLISTSNLEKINVRQLFYELENFGQSTVRYNHLKGKTTSDIYLRAEWDNRLNLNLENLYSFLDVKIDDGELINFEPLLLISDYISIEELKRIKFSTLTNQIEIKNKTVEIPFMQIQSTAMNIAGSGVHFFNNNINYEIEFSLNDILQKKFRKNQEKKNSEFGEVETKESLKKSIIPLKMTGTTKDPIISFNFKRAKQNLSKRINAEKKELNDLINKEFNEKENTDYNLNKSPDYDNMLEWKEDEHI